jgi:NADH:ubiquinone oxidoreductase subunit 4 (subunit M)
LIAPLLFLMVYMGVYPATVFGSLARAVVAIEQRLTRRAGGTVEQAGTAPKPKTIIVEAAH